MRTTASDCLVGIRKTACLGGVKQPGAAGLERGPPGALLLLELVHGVAQAVEGLQAAQPLRVIAAREIDLLMAMKRVRSSSCWQRTSICARATLGFCQICPS